MYTIKREEAGVALLVTMIVVCVMMIISAALIFEAVAQYRISRRSKAEMVAISLAEAGVEYAINILNQNEFYGGEMGVQLGEGTFSCSITNILLHEKIISATGQANQYPASRTIMVRVRMAYADATEGYGEDIFGYAALATDKVTFTVGGNAVTDAYNSDTHSYDSGDSSTYWDSGDIRSNGSVVIKDGAVINGDVICGYANTVTILNSGIVTGDTSVANTDVFLPSLPDTELLKCTQSLKITGGVTELGRPNETLTYYFTEISVTGGGEIKVKANANVIIYVSGSVKIAGNGLTNMNGTDAPSLQLYCNGSSCKIAGNGGFAGAVYAPRGEVKITGNGDAYGSFIGKTCVFEGNAQIHYDQACAKITPDWFQRAVEGGASGIEKIISWQRY